MSAVETVLGPVRVGLLARTLMHEHIFSFHSDMGGDYPWTDEEVYVAAAIDKLKRLKAVGFGTIVDATAIGLGRDVRRVARVAAAADFNIIASTGIYSSCCLPLYFSRHLPSEGERFIEDFFVREIDEGIGDTHIRAGIIKCMTDREGLTPDVELMLVASARAHLRTGVPITTHTDAFTEAGLLQQRVFRKAGVDLSNVIIGHCGDTTDLGYLERLIDAGSYIGMDRFGEYHITNLERRVQTVATLCERGYAPRMVLSHDTNCGGDVNPQRALDNWLFGHMHEVVIPALRDHGVSDADIDQMTVVNPCEIFAAASAIQEPTLAEAEAEPDAQARAEAEAAALG
jgi:phosphotriesterase-related protein